MQSKRRREPGGPSLAREEYRVIIACLWRAIVAGGCHALAAAAFVLAPMGGMAFEWSLALLPLPMAVSVALRSSVRLVAPPYRAGESGRVLRGICFLVAATLAVIGMVTVAWAATGTPDPTLLAWLSIAPTVLAGTIGAWTFIALDEWTLDDRAERLHNLAMWAFIFSVVGGVGIMVAGVAFGGSGWRLPVGLLYLGGIGWWGLIFLGDLSVTGALLWCLRHRAHFEEVNARLRRQEHDEQRAAAKKQSEMDAL